MDFNLFATFLLTGIGLCFDTFAVSVSLGIMNREIRFRQGCRIAFILTFFQALFPVLGWLIGITLKNLLANLDHWIAFLLLFLIGARMVYEGFMGKEERKILDPSRPEVILGLAVATSIDALVVGLSFGFLDTTILFPALIIGAVTFLAAMLGMLSGKNLPGKTSQRSLILGGVILILIGVKILVEHLSA